MGFIVALAANTRARSEATFTLASRPTFRVGRPRAGSIPNRPCDPEAAPGFDFQRITPTKRPDPFDVPMKSSRDGGANGTAWYLADQLGSVRDIVNSTGVLVSHVDYDSFGNVILETNPAAGDRFKFTGRDFDAETGLYYWFLRTISG